MLTTVVAAVRVAREPLDSLMRSGGVPSRRWALGPLDAFLIAAVGTGVLAFVTGSLNGGPLPLPGPRSWPCSSGCSWLTSRPLLPARRGAGCWDGAASSAD